VEAHGGAFQRQTQPQTQLYRHAASPHRSLGNAPVNQAVR